MKTSDLGLSVLFAGCVGIAACSQATELSRLHYTPNANIVRNRGATPLSYSTLYSFGPLPDGQFPEASLLNVNGTLYGTTNSGGTGPAASNGTVFSITTTGTEKVLHSFGNDSDGNSPLAGLINVNGTLYGTTYSGGTPVGPYTSGTVFSITTTGTEQVLYSFGDGTQGGGPYAGLINVNGRLYGTTSYGGAYGSGIVFSITTSGTEKLLHNFGGSTDGKMAEASLLNVNGTLYGTTFYGGKYNEGTVFSITTSGTEKVLHSFFGNGKDGEWPAADLIDVNGTLYGTTSGGGTFGPHGVGGTVFSISKSGEKVLHSFGNGTDGAGPMAALVDVNGTFYGTTFRGGAYGAGTVYSITTGGAEKVLRSLGGYPAAALIGVRGTLYGTTQEGGVYGNGTVFSIAP